MDNVSRISKTDGDRSTNSGPYVSGISRRSFMRRNLVAGGSLLVAGGLSGVLAACGDDDGGGTASGVTAQDVENASGTIDAQTFSFYQAPGFNAGKVKAKYVTVTSSQENVTKVRAGTPPVNVSTFDTSVAPNMYAIDKLVPIETDLLTNYDSIATVLRDYEGFKQDGDVYGVPYAVIPTLLAWNDDAVSEPTTSDQLIGDEYRNGIALADYELITSTGQLLGLDISNFTEEDLQTALDYLEQLKPNVRTFFAIGEEVDLMSRGDVSVVWPTYGSLLTSIQEAVPSVRANFLGAVTYVDAWGIVDGADIAQALSWIDQTISQEGQVSFAETSGSLPAVESASKPELSPSAYAELSVPELVAEAPILPGSPVEPEGDVVSQDTIEEAWNEYVASF